MVIFLLQLNRLKDRLKQKKIDLHYTKQAMDLLGVLGFDPNFGARPVKRVIQQMVENEVALGFLRGDFKEEDTILVDANADSNDPQNRLIIKRLETSHVDVMVAH